MKPKSRKAAYIRPKNTYAKKPPRPEPKDPRQIDWVEDWLEQGQDEQDRSVGIPTVPTKEHDNEL